MRNTRTPKPANHPTPPDYPTINPSHHGQESPIFLQLAGYPKRNAKAMEKTLGRMAALFQNTVS